MVTVSVKLVDTGFNLTQLLVLSILCSLLSKYMNNSFYMLNILFAVCLSSLEFLVKILNAMLV